MKTVPTASRWKRIKQLHKMVHNPIPWFNENTDELGPVWNFPFENMRGIILSKAHHAQYILQKNHKNYIKSPVTTERLGAFIGFGLLTNNGASWLKQRRLIQPGFHKEKLSALTILMTDEINRFCAELDQRVEECQNIEMHELMTTLTYRIIAKSIYSDDQEEADLKRSRFITDSIQKFMVKNLRLPFLSWFYRMSGQYAHHMDLVKEAREIITKGIRSRQALENTDQNERNDLLDMLLSSRYEDTGEPMEEDQLIDEILILYAAGHETSANAMNWCWYALDKHPEIVEKVRKEWTHVRAQGPLTFESVMQLKYTKQVIQEAMRLYPPAWVFDRMAVEDDEIDGFKIKKGDIIMPFSHAIHRDPEYWDDPETFNPDRFSAENQKKQTPYSYFPFGGGPRMCIGFQFAYMEMVLILGTLSERYNFHRLDDRKIRANAKITLSARDPLMVRVEKR